MKPTKYALAFATSFLVITSTPSSAADITIKVLGPDWNDIHRTTRIYATDGINYVTAFPIDSGANGQGDPPAPNDWTDYVATIPDAWFSENRGMGFHVPGYGNTYYYPINSFLGSYQVDLEGTTFGTYHSPSQNPSNAGNQLLLGHWWNSTFAVAKLNTWDNENAYWPAVGIDFNASHKNAFWRWLRPIADNLGEMEVVMDIDYRHRLTLAKPLDPSQRIVLDPELGRITINGQPVLTAANAGTQLASQFVRNLDARAALGSGTSLRDAEPADQQRGTLVLGKYNDNTTDNVSGNHLDGVLIVGTGDGPGNPTNTRSNGLRILNDGTVLIWPRGGLLMNEFDDGPRP
jgi:hypothetical protein